MYVTNSGCPTGYFPINTKWGGESTLSGILPGGGLRGPSIGRMSYFRPNFAMARGLYPGGGLGRMGDVAIDPTMLGLGIGALALGMFLFGRKHPKRARRRGRVRRALSELRRS
jgi:hypothetical protein